MEAEFHKHSVRPKPGRRLHTQVRRAGICILHWCVVSFGAILCLSRSWSPSDWKKSKKGIEETHLLTLTCVLLSIMCPCVDHLPSSSSLLEWGAWRGWASWVSDPDLTLSEPSTYWLFASAGSASPEATAWYRREALLPSLLTKHGGGENALL